MSERDPIEEVMRWCDAFDTVVASGGGYDEARDNADAGRPKTTIEWYDEVSQLQGLVRELSEHIEQLQKTREHQRALLKVERDSIIVLLRNPNAQIVTAYTSALGPPKEDNLWIEVMLTQQDLREAAERKHVRSGARPQVVKIA